MGSAPWEFSAIRCLKLTRMNALPRWRQWSGIHWPMGGPKGRRFDPGAGKTPWRRARQPTPVFLPGESRGQRNLAGYSRWGHQEPETTEHALPPSE